jgi:hypothetical protein
MSILTMRSDDSSDLVKKQALSMNIENENSMKSQHRKEKEKRLLRLKEKKRELIASAIEPVAYIEAK